MYDNSETIKHIERFNEMAEDSRKILDSTIITVSSTFIALILGFFKDISFFLQFSIWLRLIFILLILCLIITIAVTLYSHHCSIKVFRDAQMFLISNNLKQLELENILNKNNRINLLNCTYLYSFISALLFICIFTIVIICNVNSHNDINKNNQSNIIIHNSFN